MDGGGRKVEGMFVAAGVELLLLPPPRGEMLWKKWAWRSGRGGGGGEKEGGFEIEKERNGGGEEARGGRKKRDEMVGESFIPLSKGSTRSFIPFPLPLPRYFFPSFSLLFPPPPEERDVSLGVFPRRRVSDSFFPPNSLPTSCCHLSVWNPVSSVPPSVLLFSFFFSFPSRPSFTPPPRRSDGSRSYGFLSLINYRVGAECRRIWNSTFLSFSLLSFFFFFSLLPFGRSTLFALVVLSLPSRTKRARYGGHYGELWKGIRPWTISWIKWRLREDDLKINWARPESFRLSRVIHLAQGGNRCANYRAGEIFDFQMIRPHSLNLHLVLTARRWWYIIK